MLQSKPSVPRRTRLSTKKYNLEETIPLSPAKKTTGRTRNQCKQSENTVSNICKSKSIENDDINCLKEVENSDNDQHGDDDVCAPRTPRKQKSKLSEKELTIESPVTPPKQKKIHANVLSPSSLFKQLNLNSPPPKNNAQSKSQDIHQRAKRALHSGLPINMPERREESEKLNNFISEHLRDNQSGSLYISGPPGTGKTASLSLILQKPEVISKTKSVYINCTGITSAHSIFSKIVSELKLKCANKSERDCTEIIEHYVTKTKKMLLLVLDELDQLESKGQSVLYKIFDWPIKANSRIIIIGIANALDLTDRLLPRLQAFTEYKPKLIHFAPYTKEQIVGIITNRLKEANALEIFSPVAIHIIAGKIAATSGDIRLALDVARRVIELTEKDNLSVPGIGNLVDTENEPPDFDEPKQITVKQVADILNNIYDTAQTLDDDDETFPLHQKIILCTLLLLLKKAQHKDVTVGKLYDVYKKVCSKRNLTFVSEGDFVGLCSLIETRGILKVSGKKQPRLHKVTLQWNAEEIESALKDKRLVSAILDDDFLKKI